MGEEQIELSKAYDALVHAATRLYIAIDRMVPEMSDRESVIRRIGSILVSNATYTEQFEYDQYGQDTK